MPKVNGKHFKYTAAGKKKAKAHAKKKGKIVVYKKKKG